MVRTIETVARPLPRPLPVGFARGRRHAVGRVASGGRRGVTVCGEIAHLATPADAFERDVAGRSSTCTVCSWSTALAAGVGGQAVAHLPTPWVRELARRILDDAENDGADLTGGEPDPRTVQLLAAVTAHAPTGLIDESCAEGLCEHGSELDCPVTGWACDTCSLTAGGWAGGWPGDYLYECVVAAPCSVLAAVADHFGVQVGQSATDRATSGGRDGGDHAVLRPRV